MEQNLADPAMVNELTTAITSAIHSTYIPDVTTTADVLSALFTALDHALRAAQQAADPNDAVWNAKEINRVLLELLMEFGSTGVIKH